MNLGFDLGQKERASQWRSVEEMLMIFNIGLAEIFSSLQEAVNNLASRVGGQSVQ